jgi:hypothetical protein
MAEDKFDPREIDFRRWLPWTQLFRSFQVALDPRKLLLAAVALLIMAVGWWLLANIFYRARAKPTWPNQYPSADFVKGSSEEQPPEQLAWKAFKQDRKSWNLLYEAAGPEPAETDAGDLAEGPKEFDKIQIHLDKGETRFEIDGKQYEVRGKPYGQLRTWPWFEDRGPNPLLLVSGKTGLPWQQGHFWDWFSRYEVPVLLEPLVKFLRPVFYLLNPNASFVDGLYFFLVIAWTLATWAIFGGAITRMAAVQVARNEKIGLSEAMRFTLSRWRSYFFASFAFLLGIAFFVVLLAIFGLFHLIPVFGEIWDGLLWPVVLILGLLMSLLLVGLVGWPMIHATLSTEGSDSFDALSRSLSYVYQRPWSYLWYAVVALAYGAAVVFFVGFMGSLTVYLGKWGVGLTPGSTQFNRDPAYLFVYAPTSFGWRELLLEGSPVVANSSVVAQPVVDQYVQGNFRPWNYIGAGLMWFWLTLLFLMIVGFGYSYFWSASTIIYLLMRQKVDDTELDEVYLEEEDAEEAYSAPVTPPTEVPAAGGTGVTMVEPPSLVRSTTATTPASSGAEPATPSAGDGPTGDGASS